MRPDQAPVLADLVEYTRQGQPGMSRQADRFPFVASANRSPSLFFRSGLHRRAPNRGGAAGTAQWDAGPIVHGTLNFARDVTPGPWIRCASFAHLTVGVFVTLSSGYQT